MWDTSRGLRNQVVKGLATVSLVWALALLGFMFTATAAAGAAAHSPPEPASDSLAFVNTGEPPRTAGLVLALAVVGGGLVVLALGSVRGGAAPVAVPAAERARERPLRLRLRLAA